MTKSSTMVDGGRWVKSPRRMAYSPPLAPTTAPCVPSSAFSQDSYFQ